MIVPIPRSKGVSEENVLPLINIVFLLLIFFMIAGTLSAAAPFDIDPPAADSPEETEPPGDGVAIAGDGRIAFAGNPVEVEELAEHATRWREANETKLPLAVHVDADAATDRLLAVIDELREAEIARIRLLAVATDSRGG